jgi:hypothetical protein
VEGVAIELMLVLSSGNLTPFERRDLWIESSLLLPFVATGRHFRSDEADFFLFKKRG